MSPNSSKPIEDDPKDGRINIFVMVAIIIWLLYAVVLINSIPTWQDRGIFGDMFGAINAFFTILALGGAIYAVLLQRKELLLQRKEMRYQLEEQKRSANAQQLMAELSAVGTIVEALTSDLEKQHDYAMAKWRKPPEDVGGSFENDYKENVNRRREYLEKLQMLVAESEESRTQEKA